MNAMYFEGTVKLVYGLQSNVREIPISVPETPESHETPENSKNNTAENSNNPALNTGTVGVVVLGGVIILAIGAVVLFKKWVVDVFNKLKMRIWLLLTL